MKTCLTWTSAVLGAVSAFCWWVSAVVRVPHHAGPGAQGNFRDGSSAVDGADLAGTMRMQAKWNRWAAIFAGAAALTQAIAQAIGH